MKKKLFAAFAATLAGATVALSACTAGNSKITFVNYWDLNTEYTDKSPTHESLVYDVSFTPYDSSFTNYELDYNGKYLTTLDWQANETYKFKSDLYVSATFTVNGEEEVRSDYVKTEVIFHQAGGEENLRPVSSTKKILCHTPIANANASQPSDCYTVYYYEITTEYAEDGSATCTKISRPVDEKTHLPKLLETTEEQTYSFNATNSKCSVLDNEQFPVAFRAMPAGTNAKIQMFNPAAGYSQSYSVSLSNDVKEKEYTYSLDGIRKERTVKYRTASITLNGTSSGLPQTAEIAALDENYKFNTNRNVMLRYETPLSYNMGKIVYTLSSVNNNYKLF